MKAQFAALDLPAGRRIVVDMTPPATASEPTDLPHPPLHIGEPGELFAALPALLGFVPQRSLVLVCLGGDTGTSLGAVMRHDFVHPARRERLRGRPAPLMSAVIDRFALVCSRESASAAVALVIDDAEAVGGSSPHEVVIRELHRRLHEAGARSFAAYATRRIAAGQHWWSICAEPRTGRITDPDASAVTAAHVFEGRRIRSSRADLAALLDRPSPVETTAVAEVIDAATGCTQETDDSGALLESLLWQIANLESGAVLLTPEIAQLGIALGDPRVRDASFALAVGDAAAAAERMWLTLTRSLPDPERAHAATLLGYSAYVRGDGPLAGIAFDVALSSDPLHRLAAMLDSALRNGIRPQRLRELADTGYGIAAGLGVRLPPRTL